MATFNISKSDRQLRAMQKYQEHRDRKKRHDLERMEQPFLDDEPMDSLKPLDCSQSAFQTPKLRQCPFKLSSISEFRRVQPDPNLGGGLDGYNWAIRVGNDDSTYVLKLFWDTEPQWPHYFAAQRECQNAALLQMMEEAVSDAASSENQKGPILVHPEPKSFEHAQRNLLAFSNEVRQQNRDATQDGLRSIDKFPCMRKCHGWLRFTGRELRRHLPRALEPPYMKIHKLVRRVDDGKSYIAVVYEFIEESHNDPEVVKSVLDFFWHAGFGNVAVSHRANWKNGVLIDLSDIVMPGGVGWESKRYGMIDPDNILRA